ncbi:MAG TPA: universal stress protein [Candidatus Binatia bacterium]|jgi:nucleotide-binding universal stress UspA family protein|nr:universal stress protein [Candidatus Binatia bacterium]
MDIHTILVPIDFSEYSEKAFVWALAMAERWGARLHLLHVMPLPTYPPNVLGVHFNVADLEAPGSRPTPRPGSRSLSAVQVRLQ